MSYERLVHCVLLALIIVGPALRGTIHEEERRLKKNILLFVGIPVISLAITACGGGKKEDPVELITSAAVEETTIEETSTAEETGAELSEVSVLEAGPGVESEYIYQQIDDDQVIMAAGAFVSGSSIELSADGPIKPPYNVYFQGGLTWPHAKLGILKTVQNLLDRGLIVLP